MPLESRADSSEDPSIRRAEVARIRRQQDEEQLATTELRREQQEQDSQRRVADRIAAARSTAAPLPAPRDGAPPSPETAGQIYTKLTDPAHYTGTHRHRFDEDGRGRGLEGRDRVAKGGGTSRRGETVIRLAPPSPFSGCMHSDGERASAK